MDVCGDEAVVLHLDALAAADEHVLADLLHGSDPVGFEIDVGLGRDLPGEVIGESAELVVLRDEVRLAVHFHEHADLGAGQNGLGNNAVLRFPIRLLRRASSAFFAEDIDGCFEVAIGLGERALALHEPGVGLFTEGLYELGVDDGGHGKRVES